MEAIAIKVSQDRLSRKFVKDLEFSRGLLALIILVFASSFALICVKYYKQQTYMDYTALQSDALSLEQQNSLLQLEIADLANNKRVHDYAESAGMKVPTVKEIITVVVDKVK